MKRLLIIVMLLCSPMLCQADLAEWMGQAVSGGGGSKTPVLLSEDFEDFSNNDELDTKANIVESAPVSGVFVAQNTVIHGGVIAGMVDSTASAEFLSIIWTEQTSGYVTVEYYIRATDVTLGTINQFIVNSGSVGAASSQMGASRFGSDGRLEGYNGTDYEDYTSTASTDNTWVKVEMEFGFTSQALKVWIDDIASPNNPHGIGHGNTLNGIYAWAIKDSISAGTDFYIDDILAYGSQRVAP